MMGRIGRGLIPHCTDATWFHQATISTAEPEARAPGTDVLLGVCPMLHMSRKPLFERAGLLPAEEEREEVGFWELWDQRLPVMWMSRSDGERFWELWRVMRWLTAGARPIPTGRISIMFQG